MNYKERAGINVETDIMTRFFMIMKKQKSGCLLKGIRTCKSFCNWYID